MASGTKEDIKLSEDPEAVRQSSQVKRHAPRARKQVGSPGRTKEILGKLMTETI